MTTSTTLLIRSPDALNDADCWVRAANPVLPIRSDCVTSAKLVVLEYKAMAMNKNGNAIPKNSNTPAMALATSPSLKPRWERTSLRTERLRYSQHLPNSEGDYKTTAKNY